MSSDLVSDGTESEANGWTTHVRTKMTLKTLSRQQEQENEILHRPYALNRLQRSDRKRLVVDLCMLHDVLQVLRHSMELLLVSIFHFTLVSLEYAYLLIQGAFILLTFYNAYPFVMRTWAFMKVAIKLAYFRRIPHWIRHYIGLKRAVKTVLGWLGVLAVYVLLRNIWLRVKAPFTQLRKHIDDISDAITARILHSRTKARVDHAIREFCSLLGYSTFEPLVLMDAEPAAPCPFTDLSDEIILTICKYLQAQDLCHLSMTCRQMHRICGDQELWRRLCLQTLCPQQTVSVTFTIPVEEFFRQRLGPIDSNEWLCRALLSVTANQGTHASASQRLLIPYNQSVDYFSLFRHTFTLRREHDTLVSNGLSRFSAWRDYRLGYVCTVLTEESTVAIECLPHLLWTPLKVLGLLAIPLLTWCQWRADTHEPTYLHRTIRELAERATQCRSIWRLQELFLLCSLCTALVVLEEIGRFVALIYYALAWCVWRLVAPVDKLIGKVWRSGNDSSIVSDQQTLTLMFLSTTLSALVALQLSLLPLSLWYRRSLLSLVMGSDTWLEMGPQWISSQSEYWFTYLLSCCVQQHAVIGPLVTLIASEPVGPILICVGWWPVVMTAYEYSSMWMRYMR